MQDISKYINETKRDFEAVKTIEDIELRCVLDFIVTLLYVVSLHHHKLQSSRVQGKLHDVIKWQSLSACYI